MSRSLSLFAVCGLALLFCAPSRGQDSPSLGDLARQAKKDKANKPPAKVITNDDISSQPNSVPSAPALGASPAAQPGTQGKSDMPESPAAGLEKLQSQLDEIDSLDRATLATNVLEGNTSNFPGRAKWEEKLFEAKQAFVSENRAVLLKLTQLQASAAGMNDIKDPNDPRAKSFNAKLTQLVQQTQENSATFQAVIAEGKALAGQQAGQ